MTNFDKTNTLSSLVSFFPQSNSDKTCSRQQIASEVSQFCPQPLHSAAFCTFWDLYNPDENCDEVKCSVAIICQNSRVTVDVKLSDVGIDRPEFFL